MVMECTSKTLSQREIHEHGTIQFVRILKMGRVIETFVCAYLERTMHKQSRMANADRIASDASPAGESSRNAGFHASAFRQYTAPDASTSMGRVACG